MKKYTLTILLFTLITLVFSLSETCQADIEESSFNLSCEYDAGDVYHIHRGSIEMEFFSNDIDVSIFGRLSLADYRMDETGSSFLDKAGKSGLICGLDLGFRYYPIGQKSMKGLFIGGAFGFYETDWPERHYDNYQDEVYNQSNIHISGDAFRLDAEVGYRLNIGSTRFAVTPSIHFGYYWKSHAPDTHYKGASMSLGYAF